MNRKITWLLGAMSFSSSASGMQFDLTSLGTQSRVEIKVATGFGGGSFKGSFSKIYGNLDFSVQSPNQTSGKTLMDARSLRFGYEKINYDAHKMDWLDSARHPKITFRLKGLKKTRWAGKELMADAYGSLSLKGRVVEISFPVQIRYLRKERRKFDGKYGDILLVEGSLSFKRGEFGLNEGNMLSEIMEKISVDFTLFGCSDQVRPLLPSALFNRNLAFNK